MKAELEKVILKKRCQRLRSDKPRYSVEKHNRCESGKTLLMLNRVQRAYS